MFFLYLNLRLGSNLWSLVRVFMKCDFFTYHCLNKLRLEKNRSPSLVFLTLFSSFSFHLLVSLPFCLFLSDCMKMTTSVESKETPHKAITNKPDVQAPRFPLCRAGIEWGQVPFSKNEFSNFS